MTQDSQTTLPGYIFQHRRNSLSSHQITQALKDTGEHAQKHMVVDTSGVIMPEEVSDYGKAETGTSSGSTDRPR